MINLIVMRGGHSIPDIRIERSPVKLFGLGLLGFDHLDLVYVSSEARAIEQENWFVIEGVRDFDVGLGRFVLGVTGSDGATTLADANGGRTGQDLAAQIGTPLERGGRIVASEGDALMTWSMLAGTAGDIGRAHYPYIAYAPEGSPLPTLNSSSLVSSVLFHAGLDYSHYLPVGLRFSPGLSTLLATSGNDRLRLPDAFDAALGGRGDDILTGRANASKLDKLYGGRGDDALVWSPGRGLMHGGEPGLAYAADGEDRVSYAGAGPVSIVGHDNAKEHAIADFTATFAAGSEDLFSIEALVWDDRSDQITVGPGAGLIRSSLSLSSEGGDDWIDASRADVTLSISSGTGDDVVIAGAAPLVVLTGPGRDRIMIAEPRANVEILDADRLDRLHLVSGEGVAVLERDEREPQGAVIAIYGEADGAAVVRVRNYRAGMLGLCAEPPAVVRLAPSSDKSEIEGCERPAESADAVAVSVEHRQDDNFALPQDQESALHF